MKTRAISELKIQIDGAQRKYTLIYALLTNVIGTLFNLVQLIRNDT